MQDSPHYNDVAAEVIAFLLHQRQACVEAGVAADAIAVDPGIGFGKRLEHNLALLKELPRFAALGAPLLIGVSRKKMIGEILGKPMAERQSGGLGLAALAVIHGARIIRTHDVGATRDAIRCVTAVLQGMASLTKYFGTDGVRGRVGAAPMTVDFASAPRQRRCTRAQPKRRTRADRQGHARVGLHVRVGVGGWICRSRRGRDADRSPADSRHCLYDPAPGLQLRRRDQRLAQSL